MSKAFLRESDFAEEPLPPAAVPTLPTGARNTVTAEGAERLQAELRQLLEEERPRLANRLDDPEQRRELQALDQRIRRLQQSLATAEVVPASAPGDVVRFGDTVTVRDPTGNVSRYRIVGADEVDLESHWISAHSPLAKALLNHRVGKQVTFTVPAGTSTLEILEIA